MRLIAVGRLRAGPEAELFERYNARLRPKLAVTEVAEARGAPAEIRRRETRALLAQIPPSTLAVVLDQGGKAAGSEALARLIEGFASSGRPLAFLIGGAEGLDAAALARADHVWSFGPATWPHMLVRVMLAEQLYRAQSILAGHPYHRSGRP